MTTKTKINKQLQNARIFCETHKHRFTEPRERVLSLLLSQDQPLGAYQILELLAADQFQAKPPTVYRAIEFWHKHGFIHRIESMNAYITCCHHAAHKNFGVFICNNCHEVTELEMERLPTSIKTSLKEKSMTIAKSILEVFGSCGKCHSKAK